MVKAKSLIEGVYRDVRADILAGRFAPDDRLRPTDLAARHGVSLNVVREALNRLAGERLVKASAQQGFAVTAVSITDLEELTDLRGLVECEAVRRSVVDGDLGWESALVAAHHRLANTPMTVDGSPGQLSPEWASAHAEFHAATMSACGSARMAALAVSLGEAAGIYRYWSQVVDHTRDVAGEHAEIFDAAITRDADRACTLHRRHIQRTADILITAMREAQSATA